MTAFKGFPTLLISEGQVEGLFRIETAKGEVVASGHFRSREDAERLVECWNALRTIYAPSAHIDATEDYIKRLVAMRRAENDVAEKPKSNSAENFDRAFREMMAQLKNPPSERFGGSGEAAE